jgi:hypothetical protein
MRVEAVGDHLRDVGVCDDRQWSALFRVVHDDDASL